MKGFRLRSCLLAVLLCAAVSCTVREDRSGCPCVLVVDLSPALDAALTPPAWWDKGLCLSLFRDGRCFRQAAFRYEEAGPVWECRVAPGEIGVVGVLGLDAAMAAGTEVRCSEGCESDELYVSSQVVPCYGEEARTQLELYKQFSRVTVEGLDAFSAPMQVTAVCNGLDLLTRQALEGPFRFPLTCGADGRCRFRLPRQASDEVRILLLDAQGHLDYAIPLGAYMTEVGYDWNARSLSDVLVRIDYVTASVSVTVDDWTQVIEFPYNL